ncbi:MAG: hypothetical protein HY901_01380, partial [Deltaproteobacteria bacterium]|nr:hypothetical protein [Deltaproteobacteria bacterium]
PPAPDELRRQVEALTLVPDDLQEQLVNRRWVLAPQRITGWDEQRDVPAYGDVDLDTIDAFEALGLKCDHRHKLGGAPSWAQDPRRVQCKQCRSSMRYLFQLTTSGPIHVGGDGIGWLFACPRCRDATFTWQR